MVTWRVPDLQLSKSQTNTLLGYAIPGRTVSTTLTVDCQVHGWIDPTQITSWRDSAQPLRLKLRVPNFTRFTAEFPEDALAKYVDEFGWLRTPVWDDDHAKHMRQELYDEAYVRAKDQVRQYLQANADSEMNDLRLALQQKLPANTVAVASGPRGMELSVDDYLKPIPPPASPEVVKASTPLGYTLGLVGFLVVVAAGLGVTAWRRIHRVPRTGA